MSTRVDEKRLRAAVEDLDPASRALLELSLGRGMSDGDLVEVLGGESGGVAARRSEVIERIADDLGVRGDPAAVRALREDLRGALAPSRGPRRRAGGGGAPAPYVERRRTPARADPSRAPRPSSSTESSAAGGPPPWLARAQAAALAREGAAEAGGEGEEAGDGARASAIEPTRSERGQPTPLLQKGELSTRRTKGLWRAGAVAAAALALAVVAIVLLSRGGDESGPGPPDGERSVAPEPAPRPTEGAPRAERGRPPEPTPARPRAPRPPIPAEGVEVTMTPPGALPGSGGPRGTARLSRQGGTTRLRVTLEGLPNPKGRYELWLYDSRRRAVSVTSFPTPLAVVDSVLEQDPRRYRYVDLSVEPPNGNPGHSVQSVLRAPVAELLEP
jgi:hypothetical protein